MICPACNHYHAFGEACSHDDNDSPSIFHLKPDPILPSFELPKPAFNTYLKPDPPSFEPLKPDFNTYLKPDPPSFEPLLKPEFNTYLKPDPPSFEPLKPDFTTYLKPDPPSFESLKPDPILPLPPEPIYDLGRNLLGWKSDMENTIRTIDGSQLNVEPGGFVRDTMNNLVGQMGPLNTMSPPSLPQMPDYDPPQSDPGAWDPGFSPMKPLG